MSATLGHESEMISVQGLKAALQKLKNDIIDPMSGPVYNPESKSIDFPAQARVRYDSEEKSIVFE